MSFGTVRGVVLDALGRYVLAELTTTSPGSYQAAVRRFDGRGILRQALRLGKGIRFGIASTWRHCDEPPPAPHAISASSNDSVYHPVASRQELDTHQTVLQHYLLGTIPDDSYLASVPAAFVSDAARSFVAVHRMETHWNVGVVLDGRYAVRFSFAPEESEALRGHLARLRRYWALYHGDTPLPTTLYSLSPLGEIPTESLDPAPVFVPIPSALADDPTALKAAGAALAGIHAATPVFTGPTPASSFRHTRTRILIAGALLAVVGLGAALLPLLLESWYSHRADRFQAQYRTVMAGNHQIKGMMKETNRLASTILRLDRTFSRRTSWGLFLDSLGAALPPGLYLDKLGTRPLETPGDSVRVALAGTTEQPAHVTALIAALQDMPFITDVKLGSLERNQKQNGNSSFRILCTLALSAH